MLTIITCFSIVLECKSVIPAVDTMGSPFEIVSVNSDPDDSDSDPDEMGSPLDSPQASTSPAGARSNSITSTSKHVSFSPSTKKAGMKEAVSVNKHPSDMNAFERIAYVQTLDFDKEAQKALQEVDDDLDDGKLTRSVVKRYLAIHLHTLRYHLQLDPKRKAYDTLQTGILKEEVTSRYPDVLRLVQCLGRGNRIYTPL